MFSRVTYVLMIVALGGFLMAAGTVHAEAITIANPGIETAAAAGAGYAQDWWSDISYFRIGVTGGLVPHSGSYMGIMPPDYEEAGQEVALKVGTDNLHMSVGDQITIDFYQGHRTDANGDRQPAQLTMYLRTGSHGTGTLLATQVFTDPAVKGTWKAQSFEYTAVAAAVGQDLYFELVNDRPGGTTYRQTFVDDFSGTYTPIPEPCTLALLATGLIGLLCYAWRKRK